MSIQKIIVNEKWSLVPQGVLESQAISPYQKLIYGILLARAFTARTDYTEVTDEALAEATSFNPSTISQGITKLKNEGFIEVVKERTQLGKFLPRKIFPKLGPEVQFAE